MPLASLQFMQSHFDRLDTSRPIIALHVGNFLGVSLAYLVHTSADCIPTAAWCRSTQTLLIAESREPWKQS